MAKAQGDGRSLKVTDELRAYFDKLHSISKDDNWNQFYSKIAEEVEIRQQLKAVLLREQEFYRQNENNGIVAYHAASGEVAILYHIYSAFAAVRELKSISPNTFREVSSLSKKAIFGQGPRNAIDFLARGCRSCPNWDRRYAESTLSLNPTLFSGVEKLTSSIALWVESKTGNYHRYDLEQSLDTFLSSFDLTDRRKEQYKKLLGQNAQNGGMFQFFSSDPSFDKISKVTLCAGYELPFAILVSEYERLLRNNPQELQQKFAVIGNSTSSAEQNDHRFGTAQIRIPSSSEWTKSMHVYFYPHKQKEFASLYAQLIQMVKEDASAINAKFLCESDRSIGHSSATSLISPMSHILSTIREFVEARYNY